jgi:hypothetical protein
MTDSVKHLWLCLDAIAAALRCDESGAEEVLNHLETELTDLNMPERDNVRRKMICVVAELSRLEVRMMTRHGPLLPPRSL